MDARSTVTAKEGDRYPLRPPSSTRYQALKMIIENLFVIFAPGSGGNHLANLLSMTERFNRNVDFLKYDTMTDGDAHFSKISNLEIKTIVDNLDELSTVNNVLCGHLGEYLWLKQSGIADQFKNKKFLIVSLPDKNTLAYSRMTSYFPPMLYEYFYQEQRCLYSQEMLERLFQEDDFFEISAEIIFSDDISKLLGFIDREFCTTIDRLQATQIHQLWIDKIKKVYKNVPASLDSLTQTMRSEMTLTGGTVQT
jgi:hypothetical protein